MPDILERIRNNLPIGHDLGITADQISSLVEATGAERWHVHAIVRRKYRRHACVACEWLASALPRDAVVFETACGSGANLLWLAGRGFHALHGIDISEEAVRLAHEISRTTGVDLDVWKDDALAPKEPKTLELLAGGIDAVFSTSWLEYSPNETLGEFLRTYRPHLRPDGIVVFVSATHAYDSVPNNRYHSADWKLPVEKRRPSEYKMRIDAKEVAAVASDCGYRLERDASFMTLVTGHPQMATYMLRRLAA
ncbi:MAG: class I SAM-dependent methyltransferase [Desulfovibrio sp.]|jgi:SAM-dependent methyltransferase|nr:class I SAM-dependent methyltransferase [Desulfovibrio sp.]